jgi:hypothetical protein
MLGYIIALCCSGTLESESEPHLSTQYYLERSEVPRQWELRTTSLSLARELKDWGKRNGEWEWERAWLRVAGIGTWIRRMCVIYEYSKEMQTANRSKTDDSQQPPPDTTRASRWWVRKPNVTHLSPVCMCWGSLSLPSFPTPYTST